MAPFICTACGMQYSPSDVAPRQCQIAEEERQYVPPPGQTWTTLEALVAGHFNSFRQHEAGLIGIGTQPSLPSANARCLFARPTEMSCGIALRCWTPRPSASSMVSAA